MAVATVMAAGLLLTTTGPSEAATFAVTNPGGSGFESPELDRIVFDLLRPTARRAILPVSSS